MSFYSDFVVPTSLATSQDLATWMDTTAPANTEVLLRSATMMVLDATAVAYYTVDPATGLATNANVLAAMRDATCIQAAAWSVAGYDPLGGGIFTPSVVSSSAIGTAKETYTDAAAAAESRAAGISGLVPEAVRRLEQVNLLVPKVWTI